MALVWLFRAVQEAAPHKVFHLPDAFSLTAYFALGLTGALAGLKRGYDVIGIFFLALITAGGGGLIRDGLLISRGPTVLLTDERYLIAVFAATIAALLFHRHAQRLAKTIAVIDAVGLGAFAAYGVQVSLEARLSLSGALLGGTMTAVGGGLLRDVLVREEPLLFKPGQFYALVAIGGCVLFLALVRYAAMESDRAALITVATTFVFRVLAIRFNWQTTALYREPPKPST